MTTVNLRLCFRGETKTCERIWKKIPQQRKQQTTKHSWTVTTSKAVQDVTAVSMGGKAVGFFNSNSLWTLDYKFILAICSKLHVFSEATTEVAQIHKVFYQWGRREQALHEEIHLQMCRTFMHLTSTSNNGMVHVTLLLMKPTLKSSISSFNCPLLQPVFYACLLVMLAVKWFFLITPKLCQKSICVFM